MVIDRLRALPSVDRLATAVARAELAERRAELLAGADDEVDLVARARGRLRPSLRPVLNATGVIVHTNLGPRAAGRARRARRSPSAARGYAQPRARPRQRRARRRATTTSTPLLCELTGAEAASVVNNCAAAVLLAVAALAGRGRDVIVSRGQLIEIGGGFRMPEVVAQAGARLVEVGTTNRTRRADYGAALGETPARSCAPTRPTSARSASSRRWRSRRCARSARRSSTTSARACWRRLELLAGEPPVRRSVRAGAALVAFSGDKLLGGPQAGLLVGKRAGDRRVPAASAGARRAHRQALARGAGGDARAAPRSRARAPRGPGAGHADGGRRRSSSGARRRLAGRDRRRASSRPTGRSAAARCRCSSCAARPSRCDAGPAGADGLARRAAERRSRRASGGSRTGACCSTRARWRDDELDAVAAAVRAARG